MNHASRHIAFIDSPTYVGGAEVSILDHAQCLDAARYIPIFVTGIGGRLSELAQAAGIECLPYSFPWLSRLRPWPFVSETVRLALRLRERRVRLLSVHCDRGLHSIRLLSHLVGAPYIVYVHDDTRSWFDPKNASAMRNARRVLTNSMHMARVCSDGGIASDKLVVSYPPIDLARFAPALGDTSATRRSLGMMGNGVLISMLGQIQPEKGQIDFVNAGDKILLEGIEDIWFVIVGDPPPGQEGSTYLSLLVRRIAESSHPERFIICGYRPDPEAILAASDVVVVPSHREPFGRIAAEALACGTPVIAANSGGLPEIVQSQVNGLLFPSGDVYCLSQAIRLLYDRPQLRGSLAAASRTSVLRFSGLESTAALQHAYDGLLAPNLGHGIP